MKSAVILSLTLLLLFSTCFAAGSQSRMLTESEMEHLAGSGWCGFFTGVETGLTVGAFAAAFIPGGQPFAVGAGVAILVIKTSVTFAC